MKIRLSIQGTAPLLVHSDALSDPLHPLAKALKEISGKRIKTPEDHELMARIEWEGGLYFHPTLGPYIPGVNLEKSIVEGARITKQGKQVERGLFVTDNEIPLLYQGPRTVEELWPDANFRDRSSVKVGQARVMRTRPKFAAWALEADAELDTGQLSVDQLQAIVDDAGSKVGLGDWRPRHGRFDAKVEAL